MMCLQNVLAFRNRSDDIHVFLGQSLHSLYVKKKWRSMYMSSSLFVFYSEERYNDIMVIFCESESLT